jgi:Ca-activated chloride channel family protein
MRLENEFALWWLWALPVLAGLYAFSFYRKRSALQKFAELDLLPHVNRGMSLSRQMFKAALLIMAAALIVVALTQPGWNKSPEEIKRKGRDLVVLLDVSQSMLAEDIRPNRLERVKLDLAELIENLQGDRIGIIAFAGNSVVKCPLTQDYGFARIALKEIQTDSVSTGGTKIGDAIRNAVSNVFDDQERDFKDILLITDGEDHDSFPIEAAQKAAEKGVRIYVIGIGDENDGSRIPITEDGKKTFMMYQGEEVWSKLDAKMLEAVARATQGGQYLNVATGAYNMVDIYHSLIARADKKELEATTVWRYDEKFQIFLGFALTLLCLEVLISERKRM